LVKFKFPDKKRNLIVIIVESLETGFFMRKDNGAFEEDLIPEIVNLIDDNISYVSNCNQYGHFQVYGTDWTIAGIVGQYSGIPLSISFMNLKNHNDYGMLGEKFLPKACSIADILSKEGYSNYFICGSNASFGGRDKYFKTHGDTVIYDYNYFQDAHLIPPDYKVWWGIEDRKLYDLTKNKLSEISSSNDPFFVTILTADTHPVDGYLDTSAEQNYDTQFKNVLRDMSKQLKDFIDWLKEQEFYNNTTVVVLGDHLYMDSNVFPEDFKVFKKGAKFINAERNNIEKRHCINIFINSLLKPDGTKTRKYTHFDIYPTLLDSIGVEYNAEGLGLGRSLNKCSETLLEGYVGGGTIQMSEELKRPSILYKWLWGVK